MSALRRAALLVAVAATGCATTILRSGEIIDRYARASCIPAHAPAASPLSEGLGRHDHASIGEAGSHRRQDGLRRPHVEVYALTLDEEGTGAWVNEFDVPARRNLGSPRVARTALPPRCPPILDSPK